MSAPLRYAVVTPARNEAENIERLAAALAAQSHPPATWIVVDDGSTDATPALVGTFGVAHPWVRLVQREEREGDLEQGRREGRELEAFRQGWRMVAGTVDVVIKIDADIDFDAGYCAALVGHFADDRTLAIASGTCLEREDGSWVRRTKADGTVWGATRAYRDDCLPDVESLELRMGWDGLDEVRVRLRGLRTQTFIDLPFRHHRVEGGRERSALHQGAALGRASWYMGYRPSYLVLRAVFRARRQPTALAMVWGYAAAAVGRDGRCPDREVVSALRRDQRLRHVVRRGHAQV